MGKIQILSNDLANKIAAGEVVERPASVVKELLENAIDAKATKVRIELLESGLADITIIDNGLGMDESDALLAFKRHATSKIKNEIDLFKILSLGFRGEALPSIASVSEVELVTNESIGEVGTFLKIKNGEVITKEKIASQKGTRISVKNLFYNTPARLKYIRTLYTELGQITDYVQRIMLSHPEIAVTLTNNDKKVVQTDGSNDIRKVIASIYGVDVAKSMRAFEYSDSDFHIRGFITIPEINRASRNYVTTIINGRVVKNYSITRAILEGYHTYLPKDRYPIVVLYIDTDPSLIDVNVHPAKLEVRISKELELQRIIAENVLQTLKKQRLIPDAKSKSNHAQPTSWEQTTIELGRIREKLYEGIKLETSQQIFQSPKDKQEQKVKVHENVKTPVITAEKVITETIQHIPPIVLEDEVKVLPTINKNITEQNEVIKETFEEEIDNNIDDAVEEIYTALDRLPLLYPIGQVMGTYIVAQNEEGMFLIDQHAAVERINYEYYYEKVNSQYTEVVDLLVPITIELPGSEYLIVKENLEALEEVGLKLEEFGYHTFIVKTHPIWFIKNNEKELVDNIINQVIKYRKVDIKRIREEMVITLSCKSSLKANKAISIMEMECILDDLRECKNPFTCPHGRPILIKFSKYDIEKMFKRIM